MDIFKRNVNFIRVGYKQNYSIYMKNYTINSETGEQSVSELKSSYHREIYSEPAPQVGYTKYILDKTEYKPQSSEEFKSWTFAKNAEFYSCLYYLLDKEVKESYYKEAEKESPYPSLAESFSKYPKLPSVYLLVLQAIDIITLDAFVCMVNSSFPEAEYSTEYSKIEELAGKNIEIGAGIYSNSSYYWNNNLYARFVGKGVYNNQACWLVDFDSAPSEIFMEHLKMKNAKKSKSLYSGCIYISVETGDLLYGELDEDVVSIGKSHKYTKRKIIIKNGED